MSMGNAGKNATFCCLSKRPSKEYPSSAIPPYQPASKRLGRLSAALGDTAKPTIPRSMPIVTTAK